MSSSEVQICNLALMKFGELSITSITSPTTKEERACAVLYPQIRDMLLYSHPWNFAMGRADISAQLAATPSFQWDYAYTLPTDCLRVWELYGTDAEWEVEGGKLLTNQDEEIYIRFISAVTQTGRFTPVFANCLATWLGAELAGRLLGDGGKADRQALLQELHGVLIPNAYRLNAIEGNKPVPKGMQGLDTGLFSFQTEGR